MLLLIDDVSPSSVDATPPSPPQTQLHGRDGRAAFSVPAVMKAAGRSSTLTRRRPRLEFTLAHQPRCRHRHHNNILQMWSGAELEERAAKNRCCGSSAQLCRISCWPEVRGSGIGRV